MPFKAAAAGMRGAGLGGAGLVVGVVVGVVGLW